MQPLHDILTTMGGWPIIESDWNDDSFDLISLLSELRLYNNRYLVEMWVSSDDRNSTNNILQVKGAVEDSH